MEFLLDPSSFALQNLVPSKKLRHLSKRKFWNRKEAQMPVQLSEIYLICLLCIYKFSEMQAEPAKHPGDKMFPGHSSLTLLFHGLDWRKEKLPWTLFCIWQLFCRKFTTSLDFSLFSTSYWKVEYYMMLLCGGVSELSFYKKNWKAIRKWKQFFKISILQTTVRLPMSYPHSSLILLALRMSMSLFIKATSGTGIRL